MSMRDEEISYESLVNRWRREVTSGPTHLTRLRNDFYQRVEAYLQDLQEDYQRENKINPTSGKTMLLRDELFNMRKALEDLFDQRERKVVLLALTAARGGDPDRSHMTDGEEELFEAVVRALQQGRRRILRRHDRDLAEDAPKATPVPEGLSREPPETSLDRYDHPDDAPTPEAPDAPPSPDDAEDAPLEPKEAPAGPASSSPSEDAPTDPPDAPDDPGSPDADGPDPGAVPDAPRSGRVVVRVLEDVPAFTASDMRTYRLGVEDVAALPPEAARTLVDRGKAQLVAGELGEA